MNQMDTSDRISVPTEPLRPSASSFRSAYVKVEPLTEKAHVRPTLRSRAFAGVILLFGLNILIFVLPSMVGDVAWYWLLLPIGLGAAFTAFGVYGACLGFGIGATFDRRSGIVHRRQGMFRSSHALADVVALQICRHWVEGSADHHDGRPRRTRGYMASELNVVLSEPEGERFNLMSHGAGPALRDDAQQLAEFLNVPLLDAGN